MALRDELDDHISKRREHCHAGQKRYPTVDEMRRIIPKLHAYLHFGGKLKGLFDLSVASSTEFSESQSETTKNGI